MTELIQLLQEIQTANKCDKCKGEGHISNPAHIGVGPGHFVPCPSCSGGFIVPELERTLTSIAFDPKQPEDISNVFTLVITKEHFESNGWVVLPSPTLQETLDMLPPTIKHYNVRWWKSEDGQSIFEYSWVGNLNDCLVFFKDPNPLVAALKLLLWYIKKRKEGK